MVEHKPDILSPLMKAMGDPTRRALLTQLCQQGPCRVTDLADYYRMSLNAVSKHIKVLEQAELIRRTREGRIHWIEADLENIHRVEDWFAELRSIWELRLVRLEQVLTETNEKGENEHE